MGLLRPPPPAAEPQPPPDGPQLGRHGFDSRLRLLADRDVDGAAPLVAGSLELVGLDDLQRALGDDWPAIADRVRDLAELELQMQLGPADIYRTHSDTQFLVCFATLDQPTAERKAREIAAGIRAQLTEHLPEVAAALSIDAFVGKVDRESLRDPTIPVADCLLAALRKVRAEAKTVPQRFNQSMLQGASLTFYPAWHPTNRMLAFNRCVFDLSACGMDIAPFRALADTEQLDRVLAQLDFLRLTRSIEALHKALTNGRTAIYLLVPVTYRTVADPQRLEEYTRLLGLMPAPYRKFVVVELSGVPISATPQRLAATVKAFRRFVNGVAVELPANSTLVKQIVALEPWAVAVDLQNPATRRRYSTTLKTVLPAAKAAGVSTLAHGANSIALATACAEAGFTYVDGPAIHAATREPKRTSPLSALQKQRRGHPAWLSKATFQ
jgi:hypothetical protein